MSFLASSLTPRQFASPIFAAMLTLRNGSTITEADYQPLSSFPLKWRWTDSRWNVLPPDDSATLRPLTGEKAKEVRQYGVKFWGEMERGGILHLSSTLFPHIVRKDVSGDAESTRLWLEEHITQNELPVFVNYPFGIVQVSCRVFCRYWDDFCYPGEDILIWPVSEMWALAYWHEEELVFGTTAAPPYSSGLINLKGEGNVDGHE